MTSEIVRPSARAFAFARAHSWSLTLTDRIFFIIFSCTKKAEVQKVQPSKKEIAQLPSNRQYVIRKECQSFI